MIIDKNLKQIFAVFALLMGLATLGFAAYLVFFSADPALFQSVEDKNENLGWAINSAWPFIVIGVLSLMASRKVFISLRPRKNYLRRWEDSQERLRLRNVQKEAQRLSDEAHDESLRAYVDGQTTGFRR